MIEGKLPEDLRYIMTKLLIKMIGEQIEETEGPEILASKFSSVVSFAEDYVTHVEAIWKANPDIKTNMKVKPPYKTAGQQSKTIKPGISLTHVRKDPHGQDN